MTADQRLDQLEPLLSEAMTILDRHTAQFKQLTNAVSQLAAFATQQSDNIAFLLREHILIKTDVATLKTDVAIVKADVTTLKTDVTTLKTDVTTLKTNVSELKTDITTLKADVADLKTDVSTLKTDVAEMKQGMLNVDSKLDLILSKLT